jgi:ParB family chromosome partitioning protein
MKRKDMLRQLLAPETPASEGESSPLPGVPEQPADRRVPSGAVRAMGLDLERLTAEARRAEELERQAANGQLVIEVDPTLVDPSFAEDRVARTSDPDYRRLVESIAATGQQVPILLRPHPEVAGRYQVAYGHRRLAAAAELSVPVRAIVRRLTDAELVVAQGKENAERRNLSFIERALFAAELEARGFDRATLHAALAAHPAEVSRYLTVARSVPRWLVRAIGPAPRAGRPRWIDLAELVATEEAREAVAAITEQAGFQSAPSDRRFEMVITALRRRATPEVQEDILLLRGPDGIPLVRFEVHPTGARLTVLEQAGPGLSVFLQERLPALLAEFYAASSGTDS